MRVVRFYAELGNETIPEEPFAVEPPEEVLNKVCYSWQHNSKRIGEKNDLHLDARVFMAKRVMNPNFGGYSGGDSICVVTGRMIDCNDPDKYKRCIAEVVSLCHAEIGGMNPCLTFDEAYYTTFP
ncbi:hypothetical protein SAMN04515674_104248 [Pseudarcicella hirudinis]|uniref:Uncharacterized protein n=1 Tax=Pseudarcicella hirudinis TaxID=1079859 RepID=A0A1I5RU76_9BACT|nr:hypothetical protein [Pseudarcicella hirudinis]SFP62085.1 hypothetical protein SAMN04515674_104248 [Pseudarcicella hirudinis]